MCSMWSRAGTQCYLVTDAIDTLWTAMKTTGIDFQSVLLPGATPSKLDYPT